MKDLANRAVGYAMPGVVVDGNDAVAVYEATAQARARCLAGEGPTLIECKTYRWRGHGELDQQVYQPRTRLPAGWSAAGSQKIREERSGLVYLMKQGSG